MQFLVLTARNSGFADAEFKALAATESDRAKALYMEGGVRQMWCRGDKRGIALLLEAADAAAAEAMIESLPMRAAGLIAIDALVPLDPYFGFGLPARAA